MNYTQYKKLKNYENVLKLVYYNNTYRGINMAGLDELADLYYSLSKQRVNRNWSCRACTFKFLLNVAKLYYSVDEKTFEKEIKKEQEDKEKVKKLSSTITTTKAPKNKIK